MRNSLVFIAFFLLLLTGKSGAQNVFDPNDPIENYNPLSPKTRPEPNVIGKWVRTPHPNVTWNTSRFKCYYFNDISFRMRYPNGFNASNPTKYPLILFFHGGGEIGPVTDNEYHLFVGAQQFEQKIDRGEFNAFMLFPQAPFIGWEGTQFVTVNRMLDSLIKYCNVDENRIIVMGISIGGYGTMNYGGQFPKRSAVLIPTSDPFVSAAEANIPQFLQIPIWIGNGGLDNNPLPFYVDRFNQLFRAAGGSLRHSLYPNAAHVMWDPEWAEQPNVLTTYWQRAHKANPVVYFDKRQYAPGVPINSTIGITGNYYAYEWQRNGVTIATSTAGSNTIIDPTPIISFTGNTVTVNAPGTYRARFKWTATSAFTEWSPWPAYITTNPTARANVVLHGVTNLGNNATVTVPTFFVLNGKTSSPPIPEISIVSYQWSKVSGPAQYTISTPNADSSWVDNLVPGVYVFRLKILDNNGGVDSTDVTVTATDQTRINQTITFPAVPAKTFGNAPFTVSATASSGLPVSFAISSGPATISGNTVTLTGAGTVVVQATQAGNATYNAAPAVSQNIIVAKAAQTITFPVIPSKTFGDAPFTLGATSTSSLPVSYNVASGAATISGNTVTITGSGTVVIDAVQAGNQDYNAATNVSRTFTVAKANQTITFGALPAKSFGDAPFALTASASSGLPVSFSVASGPATISGNNVTITGAGTVVINAAQAGNTNYNAATSVSQNLVVQKSNQTISFGTIPTKTFGDPPFALTATASSGLSISYRVVSGPATLSGNVVSLAGTGPVIIEASQAGNANYNAATAVSQTFNVIATPKSDQVITFAALASKTFGDAPFTLSATASSGLPVTFSIASGPATLSGNTLTITGAGTVVVEADQDGNASFNPATTVSRSFTVAKANQTISFGALTSKTFGDAPFTLSATASSSLPVTFSIASGPATISGNTVTITGAGTVVINAAQAGNTNYNAATSVSQNLVVQKSNQTISFGAIPTKTFGDPPFALAATASSGLSISYRVVSGPATLSGNVVSLAGTGPVIIEASQAGNANYNAATAVSQTFNVIATPKSDQVITFAALASKTFGDAPFTLSATASSGLPVTFSIVSGPATLSGNTLTITGAGTVVVEADQDGNASFNPATTVSRSFVVAKANQTISFGALTPKTFGDAPFTLSATASSSLPVTFSIVSGPATISGNTVTITGAGTVVINAAQAGNANYNAATTVSQNLTVQKASQVITFNALPGKTFGDPPFTISGSSSSGLPVSFRVVSGPATLSGSTITLNGTGTVVIEATQAGNTNYNAALPVSQTFTVVTPAKTDQVITFAALGGKTFGDAPFTLSATASSGLPVSFSIISGPATLSGNSVTITGAGTVTIEATQGGNATFNPAPSVSRTFTVAKANQVITFGALASKTFGDAPFALTATASSGLAVTFSIVSGPATLSGNSLTITGAGTVVISASQPGNTNYNAATAVSQNLIVSKASQTITFAALTSKTFGDAPFALDATASSGLPITYSIVSGPATVSGNTLTITGAGTVVISAAQAGNTNYNAATSVSQSLVVAKASQTIDFDPITSKVFGDPPFALTVTASSSLVVSYRIVSGPATLSGNTVTLTGTGSVVIEASQAGNANYNAATAVSQTFSVTAAPKTDQVITFAALGSKTYGDAPFTLSATASSGLPVSFNIFSGPATLSGNTLTITGTGTVVVEAEQDGNATFNPATPVSRSFVVAKANQTISFAALAAKTFGDAPFALGATASSGLPITYSVVSGPATVSGNMLTLTGAGTVVISAAQAGNTNYNAATAVSQSLTVQKANQTISFSALSNKTVGDAPFALNATASSGLTVGFRVVSGPATLSGTTLTLTGQGTVVVEASQAGNTNYNAAIAVTQSFTVQPATGCSATGTILQEQWDDVNGSQVANIPVLTPPTSTRQLTSFEGPVDIRELYGSRIRGYICAPQTGNYIFTIAGDNTVELWLSTDDNPANKVYIAGHTGWTGLREWNKYPTQQSAPIRLVAGQRYYVEALHKEEAGGDHVSVKWQMPNGVTEAPIPGTRLSPYSGPVVKFNQSITFPAIPDRNFGDPAFNLTATASSGLPVTFNVVSGPATISGNLLTMTGVGTVVVEANQAGNSSYNPAAPVSQTFTVQPATSCPSTGTILHEQWDDIPGSQVSAIPLLTAPTSSRQLTSFEGPLNIRELYGARIRGYICVPLTGNYIFTISGDNAAQLWLSTDDNPANKVNIAGFTGWTGYREWNKYPEQQSAPISLVAGRRYYIEALHKEEAGGDNVSVKWLMPNGVTEAPIPGNRLSPFTGGVVKGNQTITFPAVPAKVYTDPDFSLTAVASSGLPVTYSIISGPATVSGNTVDITGVGTVLIQAVQDGNALFNPATPVLQSFLVSKANQAITFPAIGTRNLGDPPFALSAPASSGLAVTFQLVSGPATLSGNTLTLTGTGTVVVEASQGGNANYNAATPVSQSFLVQSAPLCSGSGAGTILQEQWDDVFGSQVADIPLLTTPTSTRQLTSFEGPLDIRELYGSRIRGYICAPQTGNYIFTIAGDNAVQLWLSTDDNPANKVNIAGFTGWTGFREWGKYPTQQSAPIRLVAGQRYYVEALHKEEAGGDHVSVRWQMPNGVTETPIPGSRLSPYLPLGITGNGVNPQNNLPLAQNQADDKLTLYPNPVLDVVHLNWNGSYKGSAVLNMYDYMGRRVRSIKINKESTQYQHRLPVSDLQPGMYFVEIKTSDGKTLRRTTLKK